METIRDLGQARDVLCRLVDTTWQRRLIAYAEPLSLLETLLATLDATAAAIEPDDRSATVVDDLSALRATLAQLAAEADAKIGDEYADRQLIAEHLIDRLTVLSGGGS
jgi:hypothetical protein